MNIGIGTVGTQFLLGIFVSNFRYCVFAVFYTFCPSNPLQLSSADSQAQSYILISWQYMLHAFVHVFSFQLYRLQFNGNWQCLQEFRFTFTPLVFLQICSLSWTYYCISGSDLRRALCTLYWRWNFKEIGYRVWEIRLRYTHLWVWFGIQGNLETSLHSYNCTYWLRIQS